MSEDLQVDFNLGASFKNTPSRIFVTMGASYRFDLHTPNKAIAIDEQDADGNGGAVEKKRDEEKET